MTTAAPSAPRVLMIDAAHGVGPALAALLAARGLDVMSAETAEPGQAASVRAAIFNLPALDESALLADGGLADAVAADAEAFLHNLQTVSRAMIENGGGQIWVLGLDDSFAYYLPLPVAPVACHTRIGAVRALAKEAGRFGVFANAAVLQPTAESVEPAAWQAARAGLGSYAQKFKPTPLDPIADTLAFWLGRQALPMNGSVIHFGAGVYAGNF